jgi:hypothetical protein
MHRTLSILTAVRLCAAAAMINSSLVTPDPRGEMPDEPPPFLGTWPRVYAVVLVYLALLISAFYAFTRFYA